MNKWQMNNGSISTWGKIGLAKDNHQKLQQSIHPGGRKQEKFDGGVSEPPRTREGATYPGGRQLRRRMTKLSTRQAAFARDYAPGGKGTKGTVGEGYMTKPGSMQ